MVSLCREFCKFALRNSQLSSRRLHYVQGQVLSGRRREYFYYIDHQGMGYVKGIEECVFTDIARKCLYMYVSYSATKKLFLDDSKIKNFTSCLKEKEFLVFFFQRLRINDSGKYEEFPYISLCGRERNYVRCDDRPIVYTHVLRSNEKDKPDMLCYGNAGNAMVVNFDPTKVCMLPDTGRVYYPCSSQYGGVGLVRFNLAIEFSEWFEFENGENNPPTHLHWNGERFTLTNELIDLMDKSPQEVQDILEG